MRVDGYAFFAQVCHLCFQSENILEQQKGDRAPEEPTLGAGSSQICALDMLEQRFFKDQRVVLLPAAVTA